LIIALTVLTHHLHLLHGNQPVPHAVFSYPQMSGVGKTEQELKEEGVQYIKVRVSAILCL
jgi:pyruvate/2-oxoglutarate dehydrogenase complex dihydrolipoamide dehydrogenase (E3) component